MVTREHDEERQESNEDRPDKAPGEGLDEEREDGETEENREGGRPELADPRFGINLAR